MSHVLPPYQPSPKHLLRNFMIGFCSKLWRAFIVIAGFAIAVYLIAIAIILAQTPV
jgi:hypothetical protein